MFNFTNIVSDILLEQPVSDQLPQYFTRILQKYDELKFSDTKILGNDNLLSELYTKVAGKPNVAQQDIREYIQFVGIYDLLRRLYINTPDKSKAKTWNDFKKLLIDDPNKKYEETCNDDWNLIRDLTIQTKDDWPIQNVQVKNSYDAALKEVASLGEKALEGDSTLKNTNVINCVQEIVNRRIGTFTRIAKLKSPTKPFTILINDIFKTPELYLSGSKKYSSDFQAIDDLYIKDLINVALAAKNFYASEIASLKLKQLDTSSFNLFNKYFNSLLIEYNPLPSHYQNLNPNQTNQQQNQTNQSQTNQQQNQTNQQQNQTNQQQNQTNQQQNQASKQIYKLLYNNALKDIPNRINFLSGKPVQYKLINSETGKETGQQGTTDPKQYSVGSIMQIQTDEAKKLIEELGKIAQYTKKRLGAGEIASSTAGALGALRVGMGPVG